MKILLMAFVAPFLVVCINTPRDKSEDVWKDTLTKPNAISSEIIQKLPNIDLNNFAMSSIGMRNAAIQFKPVYFALKKQMAGVTAACTKDKNEAQSILSELRLLTALSDYDAKRKRESRTNACWKAISDLCKADPTRQYLKGGLAVSLVESQPLELQPSFTEALKECPVKVIARSVDLEFFRHFPELTHSVVAMMLGVDKSKESDFIGLKFTNIKSVKFLSDSNHLAGMHYLNVHALEMQRLIPQGAIEAFFRPGIEEIVFEDITISEEVKDLLQEKSSQLPSLKRLVVIKGDLNILLWTKSQDIKEIFLARNINELDFDTFTKTSKKVETMGSLDSLKWEYSSDDPEALVSCNEDIASFSGLESAELKFPPNLKHLQISCFPRIIGIFKNLPNLKSLEMGYNVPIMDNDDFPPSLEMLQISNGRISGEIGWKNSLSRLLSNTNTKLKELDLQLSITGNENEVAGLISTLLRHSTRLEKFSFVLATFLPDSSNILEFEHEAALTEFIDVEVKVIALLLDEVKLDSNGVSLLTKFFSASSKLHTVELNIGYSPEIEQVLEALPLSIRRISYNLELARKSRALSLRLSAIRASTNERVVHTVLRN